MIINSHGLELAHQLARVTEPLPISFLSVLRIAKPQPDVSPVTRRTQAVEGAAQNISRIRSQTRWAVRDLSGCGHKGWRGKERGGDWRYSGGPPSSSVSHSRLARPLQLPPKLDSIARAACPSGPSLASSFPMNRTSTLSSTAVFCKGGRRLHYAAGAAGGTPAGPTEPAALPSSFRAVRAARPAACTRRGIGRPAESARRRGLPALRRLVWLLAQASDDRVMDTESVVAVSSQFAEVSTNPRSFARVMQRSAFKFPAN